MSDFIFTATTREMIHDVLVDMESYALNEYDEDDFKNLAFYGRQGIKEYTDAELYAAIWDANCWGESDETNGEHTKGGELYRLVESEYGIHKMLKGKVA